MSKLKTYLEAEKLTQRAFAAMIAVDQSIVSRLTRDEMTPSLQLAVDIERATGGFVPVAAWLDKSSQPQST